jgi:hypothetical protein
MLGNEDRNHENYQVYNHPSLDVAFVINNGDSPNYGLATVQAACRIHLPEVRVRSRVALVFEQDDPNELSTWPWGDKYSATLVPHKLDLRTLGNTIIAYQCVKTRMKIARVGEIVGKNGIPLTFPKSQIDGIAFETDANTPFIDLEMVLGNPWLAGRWSVYYQCASNNKLKRDEWNVYITQVHAEVLGSAPVMAYAPVIVGG